MASNKNPVFRKAVIPWYRSKTVYILAMAALLLVFLFALAGISVAREVDQYREYIWVPAVLAILSAALMATVALRFIHRLTSR